VRSQPILVPEGEAEDVHLNTPLAAVSPGNTFDN